MPTRIFISQASISAMDWHFSIIAIIIIILSQASFYAFFFFF